MKTKCLGSVLSVICCVLLASCGGQGGESDFEWGAFQNDSTNTVLTLGMQQEEIAEQLPCQMNEENLDALMAETNGKGSVPYGDTPENAITVYYSNGVVTGIWVDESENPMETSNWYVAGGITKGSTVEEIQEVYGENNRISEESVGHQLTYTYNEEWKRVETSDETFYIVNFVVGEDGLFSYTVELMTTD